MTKIHKNGRNSNPKPVSKSVLVTDSKNDFRFYFLLTRSIILGTQKCQKTLFLVLRKCHFSWKKFKFETVFGISDQNWFQNWFFLSFLNFTSFLSFSSSPPLLFFSSPTLLLLTRRTCSSPPWPPPLAGRRSAWWPPPTPEPAGAHHHSLISKPSILPSILSPFNTSFHRRWISFQRSFEYGKG